MARNCHKSVYHAVFLNELRPVYIYPEFDETMELNMAVSPEKIERLLEEHKEVQAVVLTSPTYDGVLSDIERISEIVHQKKIPLIVDEAHGAHFGFHPYFPENANTKGADVVIHSLHKTLPALTQTALIHLNGTRIDRRKIRNYLHIFQTSSPSYVLMASMDECLRTVAEQGDVLFETYVKNLESNALQIFDKMKKIHGMDSRERLLLQIAVVLHNCGKFISLEDVSECAFHIIMATEIIGLSHSEREMIAYTVRFNTSPFLYYREFTQEADISKEEYLTIAKITAILRLANAMDRTHKQKCQDVTMTLKNRELKITVTSQEDLSLEFGTFREKAEFFEEVFNVHPTIRQKKSI